MTYLKVLLKKMADALEIPVEMLTDEKMPSAYAEDIKDELIADYGEAKDFLTQDDIDDIRTLIKAKAERNKNNNEKK